jgi:methylmalonyl-CoA mutase cobalamin-binding subunit
MDPSIETFRLAVNRYIDERLANGHPSREQLDEVAGKLERLRRHTSPTGIWEVPPVMATATLDDGLGQGLAIIERFAGAIGIPVLRLGLMQKPESIIKNCLRYQPDFLGLTVLQFDTEADLQIISPKIPGHTRIIAGGPVFNSDPDFAQRTGTHYTAKNAAEFLRLMLALNKDGV